ncbi:tRNA adenylyltransferase [Methanoregula boonei 6A8]|uniref:CCA-adding enzyme n=1 Tax=Methanoregula boonei (strain DSM 21154 / JCM 14090 / 6A8) TaxID=456442 RepID=CCA_METB6|nr:CCA tRNA nucleotidyltransferase [Methanoregula boonei]A7I912.1 RecName: Full=CCA-adding enzyme; AltName: Full=CCA tRNA nucleotidyltransferase; AltName: Full=tRNA CCA-pyrophosphorylase; AltName: Full=tRNA adenylyl-/cytidylyl- transferase; AltName: Full=tRNA nucleotidyltransferase; AltName: Full=tRNA-NT [Methanoregula boonei 6A8]ABS56223.1 tRNA adenylyltransferase [Methanoregula boonei 6A8]
MSGRLPFEEQLLSGQLRPSAEEREYIAGVARRLLDAINASGKATGMVVGSIARNTWVKGDRDLDVFLLFSPEMPREALETEGLALARSIARAFTPMFHEKYAEHPYINANVEGIDVDLVPCYNVASAEHIQSAVDRTPFHTRYITDKINGLTDDVLLLKQFAKAGGIYGSDQMTEGFSGYLCELLVLHYGGFAPLLAAAAEWRPPVIIDIGKHAAKKFDEPLVVIDPVDPRRNVAAAVSLDRMAEFVELARGYRDAPSEEFFRIRKEYPCCPADLAALLASRGTSLYAVTFATPPFIEEIVVPQLKRSTGAISDLLDRSGFAVHHAHYRMGPGRCMLLFELIIDELPPIRRHEGPPVWNRVNAEKFREKYRTSPLPGPFIENGRYVTEVPREFTRAGDLISSPAILSVGTGRHVRESLGKDWCVLEGADCWQEEFSGFIATFFSRRSPLVRIERDRPGRE